MQVFKFGGASVKDANGVKNLSKIVESLDEKDLTIVVSAMGKTTNNLEALLSLAYKKQPYEDDLKGLFDFHREIISDLLTEVPQQYLRSR